MTTDRRATKIRNIRNLLLPTARINAGDGPGRSGPSGCFDKPGRERLSGREIPVVVLSVFGTVFHRRFRLMRTICEPLLLFQQPRAGGVETVEGSQTCVRAVCDLVSRFVVEVLWATPGGGTRAKTRSLCQGASREAVDWTAVKVSFLSRDVGSRPCPWRPRRLSASMLAPSRQNVARG